MINVTEMGNNELRQREEMVLKWVIRDYVNSGNPVGSTRLAAMDLFQLSSASLRHVLSTLDAAGFLFQPHTSAGRIPTDKGYRYFVDRLMQKEAPVAEVIRDYEASLDDISRDLDLLIRNTAQFLGDISHALVLMTRPRQLGERIRSLALHELDRDTVLLIVHMSLDQVKTIAFELETKLTRTMLREAESILNDLFADMSITEVQQLVERGETGSARKNPIIDHVLDRFNLVLLRQSTDDYRIYGTHQLLHYPEMNNPGELESLLEAIETDSLQQYLPAPQTSGGPSVLIGSELGQGVLNHMSLVSMAYQGANCQGEIHILGPTRMSYERNIGLVEFTADRIENIIKTKHSK